MFDDLWVWLNSPVSSIAEFVVIWIVFGAAFYFIGGIIFHFITNKEVNQE